MAEDLPPSGPSREAAPIGKGRLALGLSVLAAILLGAAGLLTYRYYTHNDHLSNVAGGAVLLRPDGLHFENRAEQLAFTAPAHWSRFQTPGRPGHGPRRRLLLRSA